MTYQFFSGPPEPLQPLKLDTRMGGDSALRGGVRQFQNAGVTRGAHGKTRRYDLTYLQVRRPPMAKTSPVVERQAGGRRRSSGGSSTSQLEVGQNICRQIRADRRYAGDECGEVSVHLLRDQQPAICRDLTVLEDHVTAVVRGDLH